MQKQSEVSSNTMAAHQVCNILEYNTGIYIYRYTYVCVYVYIYACYRLNGLPVCSS